MPNNKSQNFCSVCDIYNRFRKDVIFIGNFIDNKVIVPMNNFAKKHPYFPLIFSIIALLVSVLLGSGGIDHTESLRINHF